MWCAYKYMFREGNTSQDVKVPVSACDAAITTCSGGKHQPGCTDVCIGGTCTDSNINDLIRSAQKNYFIKERFLQRECPPSL
jgi:hypothetical protein